MFKLRNCLILSLLAVTVAARADITSLSDNFDADASGLSLISTTNFTVTNAATGGSVDVLGPTNFDLLPGNGNYIDLDGSTSFAGIFTTQQNFAPGAYTLSFDLAGSQRGDTNNVQVSLGDFTETFTRDGNDPFATVTRQVTVTTSSPLVFKNNGFDTGSDFSGALLDNVSVQAVPEPTSLAALALGGLTIVRRRKSR